MKYKVWNSVKKCWIHDEDVYLTPKGKVILISDEFGEVLQDITNIVRFLPSTGHIDSNNVEVYAGDLVVYPHDSLYRVYRVDYYPLEGEFKAGRYEYNNHFSTYYLSFIGGVVIGNVYDNPDISLGLKGDLS